MVYRIKRWAQRGLLGLELGGYRLVGLPRHDSFCPVCEKPVRHWRPLERMVGPGHFQSEGEGRLCPHCSSYERTRHFWLHLQRTRFLYSRPRVLHFAPEAGLERQLRAALGGNLVTTDLEMPGVDVRSDITRLPFRDSEFDLSYCSNVLEHIPDDRAAMRELFRVLVAGGLAVIQVPIRGDTTYEDITIQSADDRLKHFGQADHVRWYGRDIIKRLRDVGFEVTERYLLDELGLTRADIVRFNVDKRELVYFCRKQA